MSRTVSIYTYMGYALVFKSSDYPRYFNKACEKKAKYASGEEGNRKRLTSCRKADHDYHQLGPNIPMRYLSIR